MNQSTDFLVPESSFLTGIGSLMNFSRDYYQYNQSSSPAQADERALKNDFAMVGQDLRHAMESVKASAVDR